MAKNVRALVVLLSIFGLAHPSQAAEFSCSGGDVACLIAAITAANANGGPNTLTLEAGTYTLTAIDNDPDDPNGLPIITSPFTLNGAGAKTTILERDLNGPQFRLLNVAAEATLTLRGVTVRNGDVVSNCLFLLPHTPCRAGGGIANAGTLTIAHSTIVSNRADFEGGIDNRGTLTITDGIIMSNTAPPPTGHGGGISNSGDLTIRHSTIARNGAGGGAGIGNSGLLELTTSTLVENVGDVGGGILNGGSVTVTNSTFARNGKVGTITNQGGTVVILNSTIADNSQGILNIVSAGSTALVWNTIVASNSMGDCGSLPAAPPITSLGNNIFGHPAGCGTLRASDITGDPGLGDFTDNGKPGNGHFPLLPTSPPINAANDDVCPRTDQLGKRRIGPCDIGAIEFREKREVSQ